MAIAESKLSHMQKRTLEMKQGGLEDSDED